MIDKILWTLAIFGLSLLFGFAPKIFTKFSKNHTNKTKLLGFSNALSGGIFLSIAFFHLLPEASESFSNYFLKFNKPKLAEYPFHFLFAFISYSLILFIEKIAFDSHSLIHHKHEDKTEDHSENHVSHKHSEFSDNDRKKKHSLNSNFIRVDKNANTLKDNIHEKFHKKYINISSNNRINSDSNIINTNENENLYMKYDNNKDKNALSNDLWLNNNNAKSDVKTPLINNALKNNHSNYSSKCYAIDSIHNSPKKCLDKLYDLEDELREEGYIVEHDSKECSDEEEELVKGIIGKKGQFMAFMQARNLKTALSDKRKYKTAKVKLIADPALLKAGDLLSKTYKKHIFKENCLDLVKNCSNLPNNNKHDHQDHEFNPSSNLTPYILMIALSVHGFFEGIALGIQSNFKSTFYLGLAIVSHKWAESFTLGVSFYKTNTQDKTYFKLILLFSFFTPLGILFGILIANSSELIEAIFLGLSGGTFIYISCSEIIVEEFSVTKYKYTKFILFLTGAIFIGCMALMETISNI